MRTTKNAEDTTEYKTGDRVKIIGNPEKETVRGCIYVTYPNFVNDLSVGAKILIDDGDLELRVTDKDEEALYCEVCNDATLASRKSVNVPGVQFAVSDGKRPQQYPLRHRKRHRLHRPLFRS